MKETGERRGNLHSHEEDRQQPDAQDRTGDCGAVRVQGDLLHHILSNNSDSCFLIPCGIKEMSALSNKNRIMKPVARR